MAQVFSWLTLVVGSVLFGVSTWMLVTDTSMPDGRMIDPGMPYDALVVVFAGLGLGVLTDISRKVEPVDYEIFEEDE